MPIAAAAPAASTLLLNRIVIFVLFLLFISVNVISVVHSFSPTTSAAAKIPGISKLGATSARNNNNNNNNNEMDDTPSPTPPAAAACPHPFSELPGDPSLLLVTNMDLGDKKIEIMKGISKAIAEATGKPESYVGVSVTDNASVIFGGSEEPCALGNMYSIGAISMESNGKVQAAVTDLLNVPEARIYINFFDMPRANVGWSRRTFAG